MASIFLKINYTTRLEAARRSVRYHAFRSRESEADRKGVFDRRSDHANISKFLDRLDDPLTRDWTTRQGRRITPAKMHRLIFSMRRRDFDEAGLTSWKPIIRDALSRFEIEQGIKLDWVAAEHLSAAHPHVHVDIKSVYTTADGTRHRLKIRGDWRVALKKAVEQVVARELERAREERRQEREVDRVIQGITRDLLRVLREAGRDQAHEADPLGPRRRRRPQQDRTERDRDR